MALPDRPTNEPEWGTGAADIVEPGGAKKAAGWTSAERPPNAYFNWLFNRIWQYLEYLFIGRHTRQDLTDRSPLQSFEDAEHNTVSFFDRNGLPGGLAFHDQAVFYENEGSLTSGVASNKEVAQNVEMDIEANMQAGTQINTGLTDAFPGICAVLRRQSGASGSNNIYVRTKGATGKQTIVGGLEDKVVVFECLLAMDTVGASNGQDVYLGLHDDPEAGGETSGDKFAIFRKLDADTNWQCRSADGTTLAGAVDSGTPPVVDTFQHFRIELHGTNTPVGVDNSNRTCLFFIDGTLEATITGSGVPGAASADEIGLMCRITGTAASVNIFTYLTPWRVSWAQKLTNVNPA